VQPSDAGGDQESNGDEGENGQAGEDEGPRGIVVAVDWQRVNAANSRGSNSGSTGSGSTGSGSRGSSAMVRRATRSQEQPFGRKERGGGSALAPFELGLDAGALAGKAFEQFFVEVGEGASRGGRDFQDSNDIARLFGSKTGTIRMERIPRRPGTAGSTRDRTRCRRKAAVDGSVGRLRTDHREY